jgi:hypothetical protein
VDRHIRTISEFKEAITEARQKEQIIEGREKERIEIERNSGQLVERVHIFEEMVEEMKQTIVEREKTIENYRAKVKGMRAALKDEVTTAEGCEVVKEKMQIELELLRQRNQENERIQVDAREMIEKAKEKQRIIDKLHNGEAELRKELRIAMQTIEELERKFETVVAEQKRWELIVQFCHRITDGSPLPANELLSLFDEQAQKHWCSSAFFLVLTLQCRNEVHTRVGVSERSGSGSDERVTAMSYSCGSYISLPRGIIRPSAAISHSLIPSW